MGKQWDRFVDAMWPTVNEPKDEDEYEEPYKSGLVEFWIPFFILLGFIGVIWVLSWEYRG